MSSQSLYRKWRSQSFDDILGQPHVVQTLRNAIRHDLLAHAYLFTGPRGTGKTSMARILAKAVNCLDPKDGAPCAQCRICVGIGEGRSPDVIEIDGASNNSIEDIRVLRERVAFAPAEAQFKVYIIDEVHRLSAQAFDGLLKTLEEPPPHVLFVFASTEPHKVPLTILSRCQRFDFHKIDRRTTLARLGEVASAEGLTLEGEAMELITQQAGGSLRDALGILDQVRAFAGERITGDQVRMGIGIGHPRLVADLTTHMIDGQSGAALALIHDATTGGAEPRSLSRQLIEYWRALLLHAGGAGADADIDPALQETAAAHAGRLTPAAILGVLRALTEQVIEPRLNVAPELPLEIAVMQSIILLKQGSDAPDYAGRAGVDDPRFTTDRMPEDRRDSPEQKQSNESHPSAAGPAVTPRFRPSTSTERAGKTAEIAGSQTAAKTIDPQVQMDRGVVPAAGPEVTALPDAWPHVIEAARIRSRRLQGLLRDAHLIGFDDKEVTLGFRHPFHRDETDRPENRAAAEAVIAAVTGTTYKVRCTLAGSEPPDGGDGFVDEAERMLRGVHARQFRSSRSDG